MPLFFPFPSSLPSSRVLSSSFKGTLLLAAVSSLLYSPSFGFASLSYSLVPISPLILLGLVELPFPPFFCSEETLHDVPFLPSFGVRSAQAYATGDRGGWNTMSVLADQGPQETTQEKDIAVSGEEGILCTLLESSLGFFPRFGLQNFFFGGGGRSSPANTGNKTEDHNAAMKTYTLTSEKERAAIRDRRRSFKGDPTLPCLNDTLRRAALGSARYAELVRKNGQHTNGAEVPEEPFLTPVWMMRQAGRYLPEFRELRKQHGFLEVCRDPLLAAELTLQPYRRFPQLDAVIIFSDILVIPEAMGMKLTMEEGVGPQFSWRIESPADVEKLDLQPDVEKTLGYVFDAVHTTSERLQRAIPLIGFCGAPLTLLSYMVEGGGSKTWRKAKAFFYENLETTRRLLAAIADVSVEYLVRQADAGAQVLQVFDTNASQFAADFYDEIGAPILASIAQKVKSRRPNVVMIAFPKDRPSRVLASSEFDVISIGSSAEIKAMKERFSGRVASENASECRHVLSRNGDCSGACTPEKDLTNRSKALQGNLDPQILYLDVATIKRETSRMIEKFGVGRHIANLGHGMEPEMNPEHARAFIEAVKDASAAGIASQIRKGKASGDQQNLQNCAKRE